MQRSRALRIFLFIILCLLPWMTGIAQTFQIVELPHPITTSGSFLSPLLSPDGKLIAFSQQKYKGIYLMNVDGTNRRTVCEHAGAGWGFEWSPDGKFIAARVNQYEPDSIRKKTTVEVVDVETGRGVLVMPFQKSMNVGLPQWSNNVIYFSTKQGMKYMEVQRSKSGRSPLLWKTSKPALRYSTSQAIVLESRNAKRVLKAPGAREVLSSVWSPTGDKVAMEVVGRPSLYALIADGGHVIELDVRGERPRWMDNSNLVYMVTDDDGHRLTSGSIYVARSDGTAKANLTADLNKIALYPSASSDGTIAFNTEDGIIYVMKVKVEAARK